MIVNLCIKLGTIILLDIRHYFRFLYCRGSSCKWGPNPKLLKDCAVCRSQLISSSDAPHNLFISLKEWSATEHLQYPSESLVVAVGQAVTILEETLNNFCNKNNISLLVTEAIMASVDFSWLVCDEHQQSIIKAVVRAVWKIGIPWWCKRKNQKNIQDRKDARASKRKLRTFQHC